LAAKVRGYGEKDKIRFGKFFYKKPLEIVEL
jgi:hypothetical protein